MAKPKRMQNRIANQGIGAAIMSHPAACNETAICQIHMTWFQKDEVMWKLCSCVDIFDFSTEADCHSLSQRKWL
jgi:hypothetical protein